MRSSMSRLVSLQICLAAAITSHALDHKMGSLAFARGQSPLLYRAALTLRLLAHISRRDLFRWAQHFHFSLLKPHHSVTQRSDLRAWS